jgi:hypothetical protein
MLFVSLLKNKTKETQKKQREKQSIQDKQRGTERETNIQQKQKKHTERNNNPRETQYYSSHRKMQSAPFLQ